jgi:hypothetical protein
MNLNQLGNQEYPVGLMNFLNMKKLLFLFSLILLGCAHNGIKNTSGTIVEIDGTDFKVQFNYYSDSKMYEYHWFHSDRPDTLRMWQKLKLVSQ